MVRQGYNKPCDPHFASAVHWPVCLGSVEHRHRAKLEDHATQPLVRMLSQVWIQEITGQ